MKRKNPVAETPARGDVGRSGDNRIQALVILAAPYARGAVTRLTPLRGAAASRMAPHARSANQRTRVAQNAVRALGPRLEGAWVATSSSPVLVEVTKRGMAALAAARGELYLPVVPQKRQDAWPKRLAVFAGAASAAGAGLVLTKRLLGAKDTDQAADGAATGSTSSPEVIPEATGTPHLSVSDPVTPSGPVPPDGEATQPERPAGS